MAALREKAHVHLLQREAAGVVGRAGALPSEVGVLTLPLALHDLVAQPFSVGVRAK